MSVSPCGKLSHQLGNSTSSVECGWKLRILYAITPVFSPQIIFMPTDRTFDPCDVVCVMVCVGFPIIFYVETSKGDAHSLYV